MSPTGMDRRADLEGALLDLDGVSDCVAVRRISIADGREREWTVVYLAPAAGGYGATLKQRVADQLGPLAGERLVTVLVRRVPRLGDGTPDLAALAAVPVLTEELLGGGAALGRAGARPPTVRVADRDADAPRQTGTARQAGTAQAATDAVATGRMSAADGPPLPVLPTDATTVTQAIVESAERFPELGVRAISRDADIFITYPELLRRGKRVLGGLRHLGLRPGAPAMLLIPSLTDYFPAVWGCLLGGITCVTVSAPSAYDSPNAGLDKIVQAWRSLGRPLLITDSDTAREMASVAELYDEPELASVSVAELARHEPSEDVHPAAPSDVAVFALSSGSTGTSKVIQVTHRAIVQNAISSRSVDLVRPGEVSFNWLPFDHVAPLVMYLLRDVVLGCVSVHAATSYIVEKPLRWLDVLEKYGVHHTWSANFAYRMVVDALRAGDAGHWDLSTVRTMLNAGEQCTPPVVREFVARTAEFGIGTGTMVHMWGMAETATGSTYKFMAEPGSVRRILKSSLDGQLREAEPGTDDTECLEFMSMGGPTPGARVRIANDGHEVLPEGVIGRFQVSSPRVTPGYLDNPEANREAFTPDGWFDTGDLAFIMDGEVVITGRSKELIVINGEKYYCHEIEDLCGRIDGVLGGRVAACGVPDARTGSEALAIFFVPEFASDDLPLDTIERVRSAVAAKLRLTAAHVLPIGEAEFPRTTSGKIQRAALVRRMAAGGFDDLVSACEAARGDAATVPDCVLTPSWRAAEPQPTPVQPLRGTTLVFADDLGLADNLRAPGDSIMVRPGHGFARVPDGYRIDPESAPDWSALREDLRRRGVRPATLLYLWSYLPAPSPDGDRGAVAEAVARCGQYLVSCCRTFLDGGQGAPELVTVSRQLRRATGDEVICYPAAQTATISAVQARELPGVRTRHIDLAGTGGAPDARALVEALRDRAGGQGEVAWRDGRPYRKVLEPVAEVSEGRDALVRGGCYLVTGGAGGVGAEVVASLADRYAARFLVVGRRPAEYDPRLQATWRRLAVAGRDLRYLPVDVCDGAALEQAVAQAEQDWGRPLDGALHLADSYRFQPLREEDPQAWDPIRVAKVSGTLNVLDVVRRRPGARLVVFSSLLGHLTSAGCAAYGAGNAFVDALVEHVLTHDSVPAQSLAWGLWHGLGLNRDNPYEAAVVQRGVLSLSGKQGQTLARMLLRQPSNVYYAGLNMVADEVRGQVAGSQWLALERPVLMASDGCATATPPVRSDPFGVLVEVAAADAADGCGADGEASLDPDEARVLRTVREVLEAFLNTTVELGDRIYEFGINSIQMLQIHAHLESELGIQAAKSALFEQPTVRDLVRLLAGRAGTGEVDE